MAAGAVNVLAEPDRLHLCDIIARYAKLESDLRKGTEEMTDATTDMVDEMRDLNYHVSYPYFDGVKELRESSSKLINGYGETAFIMNGLMMELHCLKQDNR